MKTYRHYINGTLCDPASGEWFDSEKKMIDHMNDDHLNTIQSALHAEHGIKDQEAVMLGLSIDGYYVRSDGKAYFLTLSKPCDTFHDFKIELLTHVRNSRKFFV